MNYSNRGIRKKQRALHSGFKKASTKILTYVFKIFVTAIMVIFILGANMGFGALKGILDTSPEITLTDVTPSQYKTTVYDCNGIELETLVASGANRIYVTYDEMPKDLINAFVAIEDERFWTHNGIDAKGIIRAAYEGIKNSFQFTQGASTITQQLIKNSVFAIEEENSLSDRLRRKVQEQYMALQLETVTSKEQILENYLNTINLGNNNLGVQSASMNYFNKEVSELTLSEAAVIAAITQNPSKYNPIRHPDYNAERRQRVLNCMLEQGYISEEEYNEALLDDVYDRIMNVNSARTSSAYSYYTDALIGQLMDDLMEQKGYTYTQAYNLVYRGGLSIYSNEDSVLQKTAESIINNTDTWNGYLEYIVSIRFQVKDSTGSLSYYSEYNFLPYMQEVYGEDFDLIFPTIEEADLYINEYVDHILEETKGTVVEGSMSITYSEQPQCSFVLIENGTGAVRVLIGGRGDKENSLVLNRATDSKRMSGSTIKPLLSYSAAIEQLGYGTGTVIDDQPYFWDTGALVHNYDDQYRGYVTTRMAIADSRNIPAIKTLANVGIRSGVSYVESYGLTTFTENDYYLPTAIGTCDVYNYEMTAAYSVFANGGMYIQPTLYSKVVDHDGNVILENTQPETHRVVKESTAWLMQDMLHSVTSEGTIWWAFTEATDLYFYGKTGTSQDYTDKWLVGSAGNYTAGIWAGFDLTNSFDCDTYGYPHVLIWRDLLYEANGGKGNAFSEETPMPDSVVAVQVCQDSGLLPVEGLCDSDERGSRVRTEYFAKGSEPTAHCTTHTEVVYCRESGDVASPECYDRLNGSATTISPAVVSTTTPSVENSGTEETSASSTMGYSQELLDTYFETKIRIIKDIEGYDPTDEETLLLDWPYAVSERQISNGCKIHGTTYVEEVFTKPASTEDN